MDSSNLKLLAKVNKMAVDLAKVKEQAGSLLVRNIRSSARSRFYRGKYPYDFHNSLQRDDVVYYTPADSSVYVDHPAANRLEFGTDKPLTITAKKGSFLRFIGIDGEEVFRREVTIPATKPMGYVEAAIEETKLDLVKIFKEAISV